MAAVQAVVFDFGGVLISPITEKVATLAERHGTTTHELLHVLLGPRESGDHPWHRCERGEMTVAEIQGGLGPWAEAAGLSLVGDEIDVLMEGGYRVLTEVIDRVDALRAAGYRTGLLTNTFLEFRETMDADIGFHHFDVVVESFAVQARKPEPAIYEATARMLGVPHDSIVYLDDFDQNLEPAKALGWRTIHVTGPEQSLAALDELAPIPRP
jgi:epoxide hydrolase-like predicted phosphatase